MKRKTEINQGWYTDLFNEIDNKETLQAIKLYDALLKYQGKPLSILKVILTKEFNFQVDNKLIKNCINKMKRQVSAAKAEEMSLIIKLAVELEKKNKKNVDSYTQTLNNIQQKNKQLKKVSATDVNVRNTKAHEEKMERMFRTLNKYVNGEELASDEKINNIFNTDIKRNAKKIDTDLYVDYVIKYAKLNPLSVEEINELKEVVKFFITNLKHNHDLLVSYSDYSNHESEIRSIPVSGEENLSKEMIISIGRLYVWKVNKVENNLKAYTDYYNMLNNLLLNDDFDSYKSLTDKDKDIIKKDYLFLMKFFTEVVKIARAKNSFIDSLDKSCETERIKKDDNFKKKLIKKNNQ